MKVITIGGRFAAASLSLCLTMLASVAPSYAINQVATGDVNGGVMCGNCSPSHQVNTTTGSASDGSASNNSASNGSNFDYHIWRSKRRPDVFGRADDAGHQRRWKRVDPSVAHQRLC